MDYMQDSSAGILYYIVVYIDEYIYVVGNLFLLFIALIYRFIKHPPCFIKQQP